jgi:hypothetical protein
MRHNDVVRGVNNLPDLLLQLGVDPRVTGEHWPSGSSYSDADGRDRGTARATLGEGLAVSAFPLYVPV